MSCRRAGNDTKSGSFSSDGSWAAPSGSHHDGDCQSGADLGVKACLHPHLWGEVQDEQEILAVMDEAGDA